MMHDTRSGAAPCAAPRSRPAAGGHVTIGTLILAAVSAVALVLMSGCHSTPAGAARNAFAATTSDQAAEARLRQPDPMKPLQPFDEGFVVVPPEAD